MSWLPLRPSFQATTQFAPSAATAGDCCTPVAVEMAKPAAGETVPAPETSVPKMSLLVPLRASVHTTNQFVPFQAAVGQNWSPVAEESVRTGPVRTPAAV